MDNNIFLKLVSLPLPNKLCVKRTASGNTYFIMKMLDIISIVLVVLADPIAFNPYRMFRVFKICSHKLNQCYSHIMLFLCRNGTLKNGNYCSGTYQGREGCREGPATGSSTEKRPPESVHGAPQLRRGEKRLNQVGTN